MGDYLKGLFGAQKPMASPVSTGDDAGTFNHIHSAMVSELA